MGTTIRYTPYPMNLYERKLQVFDMRAANSLEFAAAMETIQYLLQQKQQETECREQTECSTPKKERGIKAAWLRFWRNPESIPSVSLLPCVPDYIVLFLRTGQTVPQELLEQSTASLFVITMDNTEKNPIGLYGMTARAQGGGETRQYIGFPEAAQVLADEYEE